MHWTSISYDHFGQSAGSELSFGYVQGVGCADVSLLFVAPLRVDGYW
jgi:hypothetical protein